MSATKGVGGGLDPLFLADFTNDYFLTRGMGSGLDFSQTGVLIDEAAA